MAMFDSDTCTAVIRNHASFKKLLSTFHQLLSIPLPGSSHGRISEYTHERSTFRKVIRKTAFVSPVKNRQVQLLDETMKMYKNILSFQNESVCRCNDFVDDFIKNHCKYPVKRR